MYAAHIIEPRSGGSPEVHRVIFCDTKNQRDTLVEYINENAKAFGEFKRHHRGSIVPSVFRWAPGTIAQPVTMSEARSLVRGDDPIFESDGWAAAYRYVPCTVYEFSVEAGRRYGFRDGRHYWADASTAREEVAA